MARFNCDNLDIQFRRCVMPGLARSTSRPQVRRAPPTQEDIDFARQWLRGLPQEQWEAEGFSPIAGLIEAVAAERGDEISLREALNVQAAYRRVIREEFRVAATQCVLPAGEQ